MMVSINENTRYHVRINNEYELELLCSYLNIIFSGKFRWRSDRDKVISKITKEYIKKIFNYKTQTLCLDTDYCFTYDSGRHYNVGDFDNFGNKVISVYDLEGIKELCNLPKSILNWLY